jgi:thiamine-phosphate pyrophosphorylase
MPLERRPIICLVTDRHRLTGNAPRADVASCLLTQVRYAIEAGIDLIQIRERDLEGADLNELTTRIVALTRATATRVVVNDRLDVAIAAAADGVHLRADSVAAREAARIVPAGFLIGRSVHHATEAMEAAADVDYLIAGAVFPTKSKAQMTRLLGPAGLEAIARATSVPVLAIGGVTVERVQDVARAGAAGIAGIGLFMNEDGRMLCRSVELTKVIRAIRSAFDSAKASS